MKVRYVRWGSEIESKKESDCFYLEDRNWDDFGYNTTYYLYYSDLIRTVHFLGEVKILNRNYKDTEKALKSKTNIYGYIQLDNDFISLGQSYDYYSSIMNNKMINNKREVFETFKDWSTCSGENKKKFQNHEGFKVSILREWIVSSILENIGGLTDWLYPEKKLSYNYTYKTNMLRTGNSVEIDFNFELDEFLPSRNMVLVGKNGVGKTTLMNQFVEDLINEKKEAFEKKFPEYKNIIVFYYGQELNCSNEELDGLKKINIKAENLENIQIHLDTLKEKKRFLYFGKAIIDLLGDEFIDDSFIPNMELSSGHGVIYKLMLHLLLNIDSDSLVIIDELETHLHPNIAGKVMRVLREVMEDYNAYSLMSTHSPIILQQVPSKNVRVVERNYGYTSVRELTFECLGANLTEISQQVFEVNDSEADYKSIITSIKKKINKKGEIAKKEIREIFDNNLSDNAELFIESIFSIEDDMEGK